MANVLPGEKTAKKEQNLSSAVYEAIKDKIINGEFLPGSILMERSIAEEFGVSRTPVREALKRLSQEGWVDWEERRRAVVSEITISKIMELFTLREMIDNQRRQAAAAGRTAFRRLSGDGGGEGLADRLYEA